MKAAVVFYIIHYEAYILIFWVILSLLYFIIKYKLYRSKEFYFFTSLFVIGFLLFYTFLPDKLVLVQKQRIRYLDLAYNFYRYGIFAHVVNNKIAYDVHPTFCSIPLIFSIVLFGPIAMFKFSIWYVIFSLLIILYLGFKVYKLENKQKLIIFSVIFILPFICNELLNPYDYPEFSNALLFSMFLYLLVYKRDTDAFLILPMLLASGNEYIFFFILLPFILRYINKDVYFRKTILYYSILIGIAFPFIYLTISLHILDEIHYFFRPNIYINSMHVVFNNISIYFPFISFFPVALYLALDYFRKGEYIKGSVSVFYVIFLIITSGWGVTPYDHLYLHFLPNMIPIIIYFLRDIKREILIALSICSLGLYILFFHEPFALSVANTDNLKILRDFASKIPKSRILVFPREAEYEYFHLLGINLMYHTFFDITPAILNGTYYLITTEFMINNPNFNFNRVHRQILRFCNLTYKEAQWRLYICKGYDNRVIRVLRAFRSQNFG